MFALFPFRKCCDLHSSSSLVKQHTLAELETLNDFCFFHPTSLLRLINISVPFSLNLLNWRNNRVFFYTQQVYIHMLPFNQSMSFQRPFPQSSTLSIAQASPSRSPSLPDSLTPLRPPLNLSKRPNPPTETFPPPIPRPESHSRQKANRHGPLL